MQALDSCSLMQLLPKTTIWVGTNVTCICCTYALTYLHFPLRLMAPISQHWRTSLRTRYTGYCQNVLFVACVIVFQHTNAMFVSSNAITSPYRQLGWSMLEHTQRHTFKIGEWSCVLSFKGTYLLYHVLPCISFKWGLQKIDIPFSNLTYGKANECGILQMKESCTYVCSKRCLRYTAFNCFHCLSAISQ